MAKSKSKPSVRKAPAPLEWFRFRGVDGHEWCVFLTAHDLRKDAGSVGSGSLIAGLTFADTRRIYIDTAWPDFETITVHELTHAAMWGHGGFSEEDEEKVADLAMRFQIVFGSLGFRLPPLPSGFERMRRAARK